MTFVPTRPAPTAGDNRLHVLTMVSNPVMFASRYRLYQEFKKKLQALHNVELWTVEVAIGNRAFEVTTAGNPQNLQLRTTDELWLKENALNLLAARLPADWEYMAWVDSDVSFNDLDWVDKTIHELQTKAIVQPWSDALDMGPKGEVMQHHLSFARQVVEFGYEAVASQAIGGNYGYDPKSGIGDSAKSKLGSMAYPHSGYAWAVTREAFDGIGGLPDYCIVGSGDHHLAHALINNVLKSYPGNVSDAYLKRLMALQAQAVKVIDYNIGYVPGTILHGYHGPKASRGYTSRWSILQDNHFDPDTDLLRDSQGLFKLAGGKPKLRDAIRRYFRSRDED